MQISLSTSLHLDHGSLLVGVPEKADLKTMQAFVPVGLLSLKASCDAINPDARIQVFEVNAMLNRGEITNGPAFHRRLAEAVVPRGIHFAGLMTDADSLHHTVAVAREIKRVSPSTLVCLGGPAASPLAEKLIDRFPWIDMVVRGEGEETFADLIEALTAGNDIDAVAGLSWRTPRGETRRNLDRPLVDDLDRLPIPDFSASDMSHAALYLDVGRGCTFSCSFCSTAPFWGRRFRMKSIPRIIDEMRLLRDRWGRTHFNYSHDIFTADLKWTRQFCSALAEVRLGVTWTCSTRTDCIDEATLVLMARAGCVEIYYGIETGNAAMQKMISKNLDLERALDIVRATRALGIRPVTGFIVGYPNETLQSFGNTIRRFFEFLEVGGHRAHLFTLCPFPGSPMFDKTENPPARRAEDLELPLHPSSQATVDSLVVDHRDIFASRYRYPVPELPWELIATTEEVSAQMVVLKRLWPHVVPLFDSAMELFELWATFIAKRNRALQQERLQLGSVADLLDFIEVEATARGNLTHVLADLLRYEKGVIAAAGLEAQPRSASLGAIRENSLVAASRPYVLVSFHHDMRLLLSGAEPKEAAEAGPHWIAFARNALDSIDAVAISNAARCALELAVRPHPVSSLIGAIAMVQGDSDGHSSRGLEVLKALEALDLIKETQL